MSANSRTSRPADAIDYRDAEPIAAKGKSEPVRVWEAVQVKEEAHMPAADAVTFVGREREASALAEVWSTTIAEHRAGLVTIVGPPGIGKSRLLAEFARRAGQDGRVHWGRCLPYGEGITYWPVTDVVKSAAGILQSDDRATIAGRLDDFLKTLPTDDLDELRTIAAALSNLIGSPTTPHGTYATAEISQGELHWGIRRMLQLLASQEPTALILEDLHWAEPTLLDLIAYIIATDDIESRLAIVCSTRPELAETSPGFLGTDGRRRTIELGILDSEQAAALLTDLLGDPALVETPFASSLISNAGGNPLFLEETVRMLRDRGLVDAERWRSEEMGELPVPTSVQGLISSRLDRLEGGDKQLAHNAAVVGAVFWAGAVAHLGADDGGAPPDLHPGLETLERRDFVLHSEVSTVAGEDEYAFKHILMRDVAYGQVPKGRRAELHVRFSDWVTILPGKRRRVRRDRRLASRAGVPPLPRGGPQPDRAAAAAGGRSARERRPPRRAEGRPPRGRAVLHARARRASRRASRRAARAPPPARRHHDDDRPAEGGVRGARGGRRGRVALRPHGRRVRGIAPARRHRPAAGASGRGTPPARRGAGPRGVHR